MKDKKNNILFISWHHEKGRRHLTSIIHTKQRHQSLFYQTDSTYIFWLIQDKKSTRLSFTNVHMTNDTKFVPHNNKKHNVVLESVLWLQYLQLKI
jgi:hypothetical protein